MAALTCRQPSLKMRKRLTIAELVMRGLLSQNNIGTNIHWLCMKCFYFVNSNTYLDCSYRNEKWDLCGNITFSCDVGWIQTFKKWNVCKMRRMNHPIPQSIILLHPTIIEIHIAKVSAFGTSFEHFADVAYANAWFRTNIYDVYTWTWSTRNSTADVLVYIRIFIWHIRRHREAIPI